MDFHEDAFVLSARAHGDTGVVVDLLSETHGRRAAYVAGGASRKMKPFLQAGARVQADYRARTSDHLGSARLEAVGEGPSGLFDDPLALIGLYIRHQVDESPAFKATQAAKRVSSSPIGEAMRDQKRQMGYSFALAAFSSLGFYTLAGYFVSYLTNTVGLNSNAALISNSVGLFIAFVMMIVGGALSDRFGRKPILILGLAVNALACIPAYLIAAQGSLATAILGQGLLAIGCGLFWGPVGIALLELFPTRTRFSASGS